MPLLAARHSESRGHAGLCIAATLHLVEIGTIVANIPQICGVKVGHDTHHRVDALRLHCCEALASV